MRSVVTMTKHDLFTKNLLWSNAEKVPFDLYDGDMVYCEDVDRYYTVDLFEEIIEDADGEDEIIEELGTHIYGCLRTKIKLYSSAIEDLLYENTFAHEDFELSDDASRYIQRFCDSFNNSYAQVSYVPDYSVGIVRGWLM